MINKLLELFFIIPEKIRYILVGGFNTLLSFAIFYVLYLLLQNKIHYSFILILNFFISVFISFSLLRFFVFKSKGNFLKEYIRCNISYTILLFLNLILLTIMVDYFKIKIILSQFILTIFIAIIGFVIHKNFSFKKL